MAVVLGALLPHPPIMLESVGCGEEKKMSATIQGARSIGKMIQEVAPDTIVVISPHGPVFSDSLTIRTKLELDGNLSAFGSESTSIHKAADIDFINVLLQESFDAEIPVARYDHSLASRFHLDESLDHGVVVPLSIIDQFYSNYKLVSINYGLLSPATLYRFGTLIQKTAAITDKRVVVIASGDLSHHLKDYGHYAYDSRGPQFDKTFLEMLQTRDVVGIMTMDEKLVSGAGECGKRATEILLGALEGYEAKVQLHSYEGPFGVGYATVSMMNLEPSNAFFYQNHIDAAIKEAHDKRIEQEDVFVKLARAAIEYFVRERQVISIPEMAKIPPLMCESLGTFVSIKTAAGLRGCIGTTEATQETLAEEIIENAVKACSEDPRFPEIEESELNDLRISVDVLSPAELIHSEEELDPKRYGLIVCSSWKKGLLLPDLEGIDTVDEQIRVAKNKAGIDPHEHVEMFRFTVERHG